MSEEAPRLLIVGAVTRDVVDGREAAGGSVVYAARVATAMGVRACILTMGTADVAQLEAFAGHELRVVPTSETHRFVIDHAADGTRTMRVSAYASHTLRAADLPDGWERAQVLALAPLLRADIDLASFADVGERRALLAQGTLRTLDGAGRVAVAGQPTDELRAGVTTRTWVFTSEDEVARWPAEETRELTRRAAGLVVTRGVRGATVHRDAGTGKAQMLIVAATRAEAVDTTGAGDVFAAAFILALDRAGGGPEQRDTDDEVAAAGALASAFAAANVERLGAATLPARAEIERRMAHAETAGG